MSLEALAEEARRRLLGVARRAIETRLCGEPAPFEDVESELRRPCGAFVTLKRRSSGEMRGCVGYVEPLYPLVEAVARAAAAAVEDGRFSPVRLEELPSLLLQISALGPLFAVAPEQVEAGIHGLVVRYQGRGGVLLPQIAVERRWGRERFLDQACRKAGLTPGSWRLPGAEILAFTAIVFAEDER